MMKVGLFRNSDGACDFYRTVLPMQAAEKNKFVKSKEIWAANLLYEAGMRTKTFWDAMSSDVYLTQRISSSTLIGRLKEFIDEVHLKSKIVMDYDDDVFNVSPMSNHYCDYGTKEVKIVHNGKTIHEWKDGENIDIAENIKRIEHIKVAVSKVDLLTVTTDILAEAFRPYNSNVRVLPNCVDVTQWNRLPLLRRNKEEIRICWAGGHSHWEDLFMIRQPLIEIGKKYPNVKIVMVGYMPKSMENDFRPGQLEYHDWVETPAHPYRLATLDIDIALIPLKDTVFNKSKSAIKWIEFSSLHVPCVSSFISPYKEMSDFSPDNGVYIEWNDVNGWIKGMETLIESAELRRDMGIIARKTVEDNFDINKKYHDWVLAYGEVLSGNSKQPASV